MSSAGRSRRGASTRGPSIDFAAVDRALDASIAAGRVPGLVAAITDRRGVVYRRAAGLAATADAEPMRVDTVFRVASMTKLFTTVAVMMLHERDEFAFDDPFALRMPGWTQPGVLVSFDAATGEYRVRDAARPITIRQLLTHTSGYGYWFVEPELLQLSNGVVNHFEAPFLMHDPGERFTYGIGTDVLGRLVERASGLPLGRFVAERIAAPLGMRATGWQPPADPSRLAALHRRPDRGYVHGRKDRAGEEPHGGGGLYTTADDYLALSRVLLNEGATDDGRRLLAPASVAEIATNQIGTLFAAPQRAAYRERSLDFTFLDGTQKFGFNVMIETEPRATGRPVGSYGWGGVFNTYYWVDPGAGFAAVLLMQLSPFCDPGCWDTYLSFERAVYRA